MLLGLCTREWEADVRPEVTLLGAWESCVDPDAEAAVLRVWLFRALYCEWLRD